jgi:hypothetical protein
MAVRVLAVLVTVPLLTVAEPVFSCATPTATLSVDGSLRYSYAVGNQTWLEDGDVSAHYGGQYFTASSGALIPRTPMPGSGSDSFGAFTSFSVDWTASALPYAFTTVFKCYAEAEAPLAPLVAFSTAFPGGASGAISTSSEDDPAGAPNGYNSSAAPIVVRGGGQGAAPRELPGEATPAFPRSPARRAAITCCRAPRLFSTATAAPAALAVAERGLGRGGGAPSLCRNGSDRGLGGETAESDAEAGSSSAGGRPHTTPAFQPGRAPAPSPCSSARPPVRPPASSCTGAVDAAYAASVASLAGGAPGGRPRQRGGARQAGCESRAGTAR